MQQLRRNLHHIFFDQNHTTKIFTAFILDDDVKLFAKVDYRHEQEKAKLHSTFFHMLDVTLKHNLFAPLAMAIIVTKHSTQDLCHTASYLQQLDAELRLRPLRDGNILHRASIQQKVSAKRCLYLRI